MLKLLQLGLIDHLQLIYFRLLASNRMLTTSKYELFLSLYNKISRKMMTRYSFIFVYSRKIRFSNNAKTKKGDEEKHFVFRIHKNESVE